MAGKASTQEKEEGVFLTFSWSRGRRSGARRNYSSLKESKFRFFEANALLRVSSPFDLLSADFFFVVKTIPSLLSVLAFFVASSSCSSLFPSSFFDSSDFSSPGCFRLKSFSTAPMIRVIWGHDVPAVPFSTSASTSSFDKSPERRTTTVWN